MYYGSLNYSGPVQRGLVAKVAVTVARGLPTEWLRPGRACGRSVCMEQQGRVDR